MKPISVAYFNKKPGVAKTTSAVYTCAAFHAMGLTPLLVDADKSASAQAWGDLAGGFPWPTIGMPTRTIHRQLPMHAERLGVDAVVIDTPQAEDHESITRSALAAVDTWIIPVAPSGIEVHRTAQVRQDVEEVLATLHYTPDVLVMLTRANRRRPPKSGSDATTRAAFEGHGFSVFGDQVPMQDNPWRVAWGTVPETLGTPYELLARYLIAQHEADDGWMICQGVTFEHEGSSATGRIVDLGGPADDRIAVIERGNGVSRHRVPVAKITRFHG